MHTARFLGNDFIANRNMVELIIYNPIDLIKDRRFLIGPTEKLVVILFNYIELYHQIIYNQIIGMRNRPSGPNFPSIYKCQFFKLKCRGEGRSAIVVRL